MAFPKAGAYAGDAASRRRQAVLLSVILYPGAGQWLQGRWLAAALYAGVFTLAFVPFLWQAAVIILAFYRFAFHFMEAEAPTYRLLPMILCLAFSIGVYILNIFDAALYRNRSAPDHHPRS
jgi:hypothetical protein